MIWLVFFSCWAASPQELSQDEFTRLHKELTPVAASWQTIPWQTSLVKAQNMAVRENKPIFIWAMDGHPLGCT